LTGRGRCAAHKQAEQRPNAAARGYGARWRRLRLIILRRDPMCRWPGCNKASTDVDHRIAREDGGTDAESNLWGLCHSHHSRKTVASDGGFGRITSQAAENKSHG
jgi:5-methylcytosine-specific restriction protein A